MAFKLRTSKKTENTLDKITISEHIPWYSLVKLAMVLSIKSGPLEEEDFGTNNLGKELNRQTVTGDADALYKCLIEMREGKHLTDDEFFPDYVKAHIDRGSEMLAREKKYSSNLIEHLIHLDQSL